MLLRSRQSTGKKVAFNINKVANGIFATLFAFSHFGNYGSVEI